MIDRLFCYGTLCVPEIRRLVLGRDVSAVHAILPGFRSALLHGEVYPGVLPARQASTTGLLCRGLQAKDLKALDRYEGAEYRREARKVITCDQRPVQAWVYVLAAGFEARLSRQHWDARQFKSRHLYLAS